MLLFQINNYCHKKTIPTNAFILLGVLIAEDNLFAKLSNAKYTDTETKEKPNSLLNLLFCILFPRSTILVYRTDYITHNLKLQSGGGVKIINAKHCISSIPQELHIIKTQFCISSLRKLFDTHLKV